MFVDQATIETIGGNGGDGCVSFRREAHVPKGGPDGGDGGDGGSVSLVADSNEQTLLPLAGRHHWRAGHGGGGGPKQQHGRNGRRCEVRVPPGTVVRDAETGASLGDLARAGERLVVARGGRGGRGNAHFRSPTRQTPEEATPGEPGEQRRLALELKLVAEIGLAGLPNAGKSTLLSRLSRARPQVADYPFTTLAPHLGVIELPGDRRLVAADIPGLIEGASKGQGLGIAFLRHVERTRLLWHVVEPEPMDGSDPLDNIARIERELAGYGAGLAEKPRLIVINKAELLSADAQGALGDRVRTATGIDPWFVSAATGGGLDALLEAAWRRLEAAASEPE